MQINKSIKIAKMTVHINIIPIKHGTSRFAQRLLGKQQFNKSWKCEYLCFEVVDYWPVGITKPN